MTFILNVLHKNFSVIVSDKRGNLAGEAEINLGRGALKVFGKNITIEGVQKIFLNQPKTLAVGIAGTVGDHGYVNELPSAQSNVKGLEVIHKHLATTYANANRKALCTGEVFMENQAIASFFDEDVGVFFSNICLFSPEHYGGYMHHSGNGNRLLHVGSGSNFLEKAVGIESINNFINSIRDIHDPSDCLDWVRLAFRQVSEATSDCGTDFVAYAASRNDHEFVELK